MACAVFEPLSRASADTLPAVIRIARSIQEQVRRRLLRVSSSQPPASCGFFCRVVELNAHGPRDTVADVDAHVQYPGNVVLRNLVQKVEETTGIKPFLRALHDSPQTTCKGWPRWSSRSLDALPPAGYVKIPTVFRMKIRRAAPSTATIQLAMGPPAESPTTPASQNPRLEPMMPTTMLAMTPICAFVFMRMLASQPTMAPTISVTIQYMPAPPRFERQPLGFAGYPTDSTRTAEVSGIGRWSSTDAMPRQQRSRPGDSTRWHPDTRPAQPRAWRGRRRRTSPPPRRRGRRRTPRQRRPARGRRRADTE